MPRVREHCPVASLEGIEGAHIISRYEDVKFALRHPEIFSSDLVAVDIGQDRPLIPLQIDPPEHAKYRRLMDPQLGPREIAPLEADTRKLVNEIIDGSSARGSCDFHAEFSVPVPCTVFLQLSGLPLDELEQFTVWKDNIIRPQMSRISATWMPRGGDGAGQGDVCVLRAMSSTIAWPIPATTSSRASSRARRGRADEPRPDPRHRASCSSSAGSTP